MQRTEGGGINDGYDTEVFESCGFGTNSHSGHRGAESAPTRRCVAVDGIGQDAPFCETPFAEKRKEPQPLSCRKTLGDAWPMVEILLFGVQNVSTLSPPPPGLYPINGCTLHGACPCVTLVVILRRNSARFSTQPGFYAPGASRGYHFCGTLRVSRDIFSVYARRSNILSAPAEM